MHVAPTPVPETPFSGPGVWQRSDFAEPSDWTHPLAPATVRELDDALAAIRAQGKQLAALTRQDFPLGSFEAEAARLRDELMRGRGFLVVRGLPVNRYSPEEAVMAYWGLASFLGATLPQNAKGDRVYSVRDEGYQIERDYGTVGVRFSKTTVALDFHTDSAPAMMGATPDVVGLLTLRAAKSGGASALVSAYAAHNAIRRERPDCLARLYQCYHFDRRAELREGEPPTLVAPVFTFDAALAIRYFRFYIPKGHELAGAPLGQADVAALDFLDSVLNRPELQVRFEMRPGDIQLVNNRFVLHSRTAYQDHPEPELRRHLVRLWLQIPGGR